MDCVPFCATTDRLHWTIQQSIYRKLDTTHLDSSSSSDEITTTGSSFWFTVESTACLSLMRLRRHGLVSEKTLDTQSQQLHALLAFLFAIRHFGPTRVRLDLTLILQHAS